MFAPQAQGIFDNATPFHTADHMLDPHTNTSTSTVLGFCLGRQCRSSWLFRRLLHHHPGHGKALKAQVLIQHAVGRQTILLLVSKAFIVPLPFICGTEKANPTRSIDKHKIFQGVLLLLATVVECLFIRIRWSIDGAFGASMKKRAGPLAEPAWKVSWSGLTRQQSATARIQPQPGRDSRRDGADESTYWHWIGTGQRAGRAPFAWDTA